MIHDIYLIKIGDPDNHILFFDCGIHAREWIAPASCLYVIQEWDRPLLFENYFSWKVSFMIFDYI